tara:strand:- start:298 stop:633 length:336 start_codon:yes stop_codon:yes gene_type:complete
MIKLTLHIRTVSEANRSGHWAKHHKRHQEQRWYAAAALQEHRPLPPLPVKIVLTRVAPRKLDTDNLASSMKHIRDGIADCFEIDDGNEGYDWQYAQRHGKDYQVVVEITAC